MVTRHDVIQSSEATTLSGKIGLILGGLPEDNDTLPSVLFITLYSALFIPVFWRIQKHTITFGQVWKPLLVIMMRVATFALRIKLSDGQDWSQNVFVTQLILLRLGPIILTSALICLLRDAVIPYLPTVDAPNMTIKLLLKYFVSFLNMATYFAFGLTIAIAFDVKAAINGNPEARVKMHISKQISIWMLVAIDACIYILVITPMVRLYQGRYIQRLVVSRKKEESKFLAIASVCTFLLVVSAFKALQLAAHGRFTSRYALVVNKKILFYCVCCAGEYIACLCLIALPWARMVPAPELLEAFCRVYGSNEGTNGSNANCDSNETIQKTTNVIPWPQPPPPGIISAGAGTGGSNCEYYSNFPSENQRGIADGKLVTQFLATSNQLKAPEGMYGEQMKEVIPKYATVHRITIPEDFNKARQSYPRQLLLSPSSASPMREKFTRQDEKNINSQPLPILSQESNEEQDSQQQQHPRRNSRSFVFSTGGGIQPMGYNPSTSNHRASLVPLSTISEVGDDGLGNTRSVYRNSVWHPRNSILGGKAKESRSPLPLREHGGVDGGGESDDSKGNALSNSNLHHSSWESTHSSTHSGLASTTSSDSINLPPHLIPIAPPRSAPLPPITPTNVQATELGSDLIKQTIKGTKIIHDEPMTNVQLQEEYENQTGTETNQIGTYLFDNSFEPQNPIAQSHQPKVRQSSTCSVRSHWSDDSDHGITTNKNSSSIHRFGSLRGRREGKSSTRADSLEWD